MVFALILFACISAAAAIAYGLRVVNRTPALAIGPRMQSAYDRGVATLGASSGSLRAAWEHDQIARMISRALVDRTQLRALRTPREFAAIGRERSGSQLGRVFQITILMAALDGAQPIDEWQPLLFPYFEGLKDANFALYWPELRDAWRRTFVTQGLTPGMARLGAATLALPYGPPLQFFTSRSLAYADALAANEATRGEADTVRRVTLRLLRQWTSELGPAETRLLASDLLADALERESIAAMLADELPASERAALIADLRSFRAAYRDSAKRRVKWFMRIDDRPQLAPRAENTIGWRAGLGLWVGLGLVVALFALLVFSWAWLLRGGVGLRLKPLWRYSAMYALGVVVTGVVVLFSAWDWVAYDLKAMRFQVVVVAAAVAMLLLLLTAIASASAGGRFFARVAAIGAQSAIFLAVALMIVGALTNAALRDYDRQLALGPDDYTMVAGSDADRLRRLRDWRP